MYTRWTDRQAGRSGLAHCSCRKVIQLPSKVSSKICVWQVGYQNHLARLVLVHLNTVQMLWKVDEEAALVAVQPPLWGGKGIEHQGAGVTFRAGGDPLLQEGVLAAYVGAHCARHAALAGSQLPKLQLKSFNAGCTNAGCMIRSFLPACSESRSANFCCTTFRHIPFFSTAMESWEMQGEQCSQIRLKPNSVEPWDITSLRGRVWTGGKIQRDVGLSMNWLIFSRTGDMPTFPAAPCSGLL